MDKFELHFQFFGSVPLNMVVAILKACNKEWPGCFCLDSEHEISKRTGALMSVVTKK